MIKKPKSKVVGCETCLFRVGDIYTDKTPDKTKRVFCNVRYVDVDVAIMNKFCDFFKMKPLEE